MPGVSGVSSHWRRPTDDDLRDTACSARCARSCRFGPRGYLRTFSRWMQPTHGGVPQATLHCALPCRC